MMSSPLRRKERRWSSGSVAFGRWPWWFLLRRVSGGSIRPAQHTVEAVPAAVFDRRCDDLVGGPCLVEFLRQALRDDRLLARVQIARVEVEIAVLHLMI